MSRRGRRVVLLGLGGPAVAILLLSGRLPGTTDRAGPTPPEAPVAPGDRSRTSGSTGAEPNQPASTSTRLAIPAPGSYVYDFAGSLLTDAGTEKYRTKLNQTVEVEAQADGTAVRFLSGPADLRSTDLTLWRSDGIVRLSTTATGPDESTHRCTYLPPLVLMRFPVRVGSLGLQRWSSPECSGEVEIRVAGVELARDTAGRRWESWKVEQRPSSGPLVEARLWISPHLGVEVRAERLLEQQHNGTTERTTQVTTLVSAP